MLGSMKTRSAFTIFHFWCQKMIFSFLFSYGSCPRSRSRTKRSVRTQTKIICCFWLLQTTYMEEMKAGSTGPLVQLTLLSPIGLVGLLGVSLQLTLPSGCSVRYLRRLFTNNPENCKTPSPCQTLSSCLHATRATLWRRLKVSFS